MMRRLYSVSLLCVFSTACASSPLLRQQCFNPDAQLARIMQPYEAARAKGCGAGTVQPEGSACDQIGRAHV